MAKLRRLWRHPLWRYEGDNKHVRAWVNAVTGMPMVVGLLLGLLIGRISRAVFG